MNQADLSGYLFQQTNLFATLTQNPATSKYLGKADVCRILSELMRDPSAFNKYRDDSRIMDIATQLAALPAPAQQWPPSWSSYNKTTNNTNTNTNTNEEDHVKWQRSARRARMPMSQTYAPSAPVPPSVPVSASSGVFEAVKSGILSRVSTLVDRNLAALFQEDDFGYTPLHVAAQKGDRSIVGYLLGKGADVNHKSQAGGYTPLHIAVLADKVNIALSLIEHGADVQSRDSEGNTPLEYALRNDNPELISVLIETATSSQPAQPAVAAPAATWTEEDTAPSLFGDEFKPAVLPRRIQTVAATTTTTTTSTSRSKTSEDETADLGDLFGWDNDEFEFMPKGKEAKPSSATRSDSPVSRIVEEEEEDDTWGFLFGDDSDSDSGDSLFSTDSSQRSKQVAFPFTSPTSSTTTVTTRAAPTASAPSPTMVAPVSEGSEADGLLAQIQQLETRLAEKQRELLVKEDKISILEEDTRCRICMDHTIETVLLWCGHNILCLECSRKVQTAKRECPVCSKPVTRVVRTYRA